MAEDFSEPHPCQRFDVFDEDWNRIAVGTKMPSGLLVVEWVRESFPEEERTDAPVLSQYRNLEDAKQATGGEIIFEDPS